MPPRYPDADHYRDDPYGRDPYGGVGYGHESYRDGGGYPGYGDGDDSYHDDGYGDDGHRRRRGNWDGDDDEDRRRRRSRLPPNPGTWLVVVGLIALAAAGGAVVGAQRAGAPTAAGGVEEAEQTVIAYFDALGGQDCPTALGLVSDLSWRPGGAFASAEEAQAGCSSGELQAQTPALDVERVEVLSQEAGRITVEVTGVVDGQPQTVQLTLVQDGNEWKIQLPGPEPAPTVTSPGAPPAGGAPGDPGGEPPATAPTTAPGAPAGDTGAAQAVVRSFYEAMAAQDCATLVGLTTPEFWTSLVTGADPADPAGACDQAFAEGFLTTDITVDDVVPDRQQDGTATFSVALTLGAGGTAYTELVDAVEAAGTWKVNLIY